jgi:hypothetical protein
MTNIFYGPVNPTGAQTSAAVDGDIFIGVSTLIQRRKTGATWTIIVPSAGVRTTPSDTRGDTVPWVAGDPDREGQINDRLAVIGSARPWEIGWRNAAAGVVGPPASASPTGTEGAHEQTTASDTWTVNHELSADIVNVTVIADDGESILIPRVEYAGPMTCILHFAEPVTGTAIVRR